MFVKICGITREADALLAVAMGADAVGFTFAPSVRQVAPTIVRDIVRRLPPEILTVGVFRDEAPDRVVEIVNTAGLRAAQLHGHESVEATRSVGSRVPVVFKAFSASAPALERAGDYGVKAILVDSARPGSGEAFDWALAERHAAEHRLILAGGLDPDNVAAAISQVGPWGVDVASGVEADRGEPGQKDARRVKAFIEAAKAAVPAEHPMGHRVATSFEPYDWLEDDAL